VPNRTRDSRWRLAADLVSARVLVWIARFGRETDLTRDAHLFFADRYRRLSEIHRGRNHLVRAARLEHKAQEHHYAAGGDGPPYAAAMALPRPRRFVTTNAVSSRRLDGPDDAA
jgi:hypothetical protein